MAHDEYTEESREEALRRRMRQRVEDIDGDEEDGDEEPYSSRAPRGGRRSQPYPPNYQRNGCAATALYALLGVLAVVLLLLIILPRIMSNVAAEVPAQIVQIVASPTPKIIDRGGTIQQIRNLNRLETQNFSVERVVEASIQRGNVLDLLLGERLLLIASGNVVAGVDLSKLKADDVTISDDGESISITLPPSEIFMATLDNSRTRVYDKQTGIGTRLMGGENKDLETQARQNAESEILKAACEGGVMQKSADQGRSSMEQFLRVLGFSHVSVNVPAGPCTVAAQ